MGGEEGVKSCFSQVYFDVCKWVCTVSHWEHAGADAGGVAGCIVQ